MLSHLPFLVKNVRPANGYMTYDDCNFELEKKQTIQRGQISKLLQGLIRSRWLDCCMLMIETALKLDSLNRKILSRSGSTARKHRHRAFSIVIKADQNLDRRRHDVRFSRSLLQTYLAQVGPQHFVSPRLYSCTKSCQGLVD